MLDHPDVLDPVARAEQAVLDSPAVLGGNAFNRDQAARMAERDYQVIALGFDRSLQLRGAGDALPANLSHCPGHQGIP